MNQIMVVFWSQTGNTEAMANAVAEGIREAGKDALVTEVSHISADALKDAGVFALGCPAMGAEVLEESEMEPFVTEVEAFASGKHIGLFGSYGWGDGEWMRDWQARMAHAGADVVGGEGVIAQESPDEDALNQCRKLGKALAAAESIRSIPCPLADLSVCLFFALWYNDGMVSEIGGMRFTSGCWRTLYACTGLNRLCMRCKGVSRT